MARVARCPSGQNPDPDDGRQLARQCGYPPERENRAGSCMRREVPRTAPFSVRGAGLPRPTSPTGPFSCRASHPAHGMEQAPARPRPSSSPTGSIGDDIMGMDRRPPRVGVPVKVALAVAAGVVAVGVSVGIGNGGGPAPAATAPTIELAGQQNGSPTTSRRHCDEDHCDNGGRNRAHVARRPCRPGGAKHRRAGVL